MWGSYAEDMGYIVKLFSCKSAIIIYSVNENVLMEMYMFI